MAGLLDFFQNPATMNLAASLLAAGGPSRTPVSTGQAIGSGLLAYQQGLDQDTERKFRDQQMKKMIADQELKQKQELSWQNIGASDPTSFGFKVPEGLPFADAVNVPEMRTQISKSMFPSSTDNPSNVREWEYYNNLTPEQKQQYLSMKRADQWKDLGNQVVMPTPGVPGQVSAVMPKGLPPQDLPSVRGAQSSAVEGAKTAWLAEQERQKLEGSGAISPEQKKGTAQTQVSGILDELRGHYKKLDEKGGIVSTERGTAKNIPARLGSSSLGQAVGGAVGTEEQSIRNMINQSRPLLINYIRQASEMGARGLDSEKELEFYLKAATDPALDVQANLNALKVLEDAYGEGARKNAPARPQAPTRGTVKGGYRFNGGDPANPSSWTKVQ